MITAACTTGSTVRPGWASRSGRSCVVPLLASASLLMGVAPVVAQDVARAEPIEAERSDTAPASLVPLPPQPESARLARELTDSAIRYEQATDAGYGVARAYALYCRAARLEYPDALMRMGWMHAQGRGRPRDDAIANTLFRRAAGVTDGHDKLPDCLRRPYEPIAVAEPAPEPPVPVSNDEPPRIIELRAPARPAVPEVNAPRALMHTVAKLSREFRLDPRLVLAVIRTESNFDHNARSHRNAQGLMQLIPETAERFAVRDAFNPVDNLRGGMRYLRWLLSYFRGDVVLALAGYNAGERAVDRHRGVPPYAETAAYVRRIQALYPHDHHPFDEQVTAPPDWLSTALKARERAPALLRASHPDASVDAVAGPPPVNQHTRRSVQD